MDSIRGFWVAVPTPLDASGLVDQATLVAHCKSMFEQGCDGVVLFGTSGEGTSFSGAERLHAVGALLAGGIAASRIGLGVGAPATPDAVSLSRAALELGLTQLLALPPYFYRDIDEDGIEESFCRLIDGVGDNRLRLTLYHIPQTSGVPVAPAVAGRLRARFGGLVAGVKDSSGRFANFEAFRNAAPELAITVGSEVDIHRAMRAGGAGTICGLGNIAPAAVLAMFDGPDAEPEMRRIAGLIQGAFVPTVKSVLAAQTGNDGWRRVRAPLRSAERALGDRLAQQFKAPPVS